MNTQDREDLREIRKDVKELIDRVSRLESGVKTWGAIAGTIAAFLTGILQGFFKGS